jgi:hypothetical protein
MGLWPAAGGCRPGILCRAGEGETAPFFFLFFSPARLSGPERSKGKERSVGVREPGLKGPAYTPPARGKGP